MTNHSKYNFFCFNLYYWYWVSGTVFEGLELNLIIIKWVLWDPKTKYGYQTSTIWVWLYRILWIPDPTLCTSN